MAQPTQAQMIQETLSRVKKIEALLESLAAEPASEPEGITLEADSRGNLLARLRKTIRF
ncbi:MAG: hypothetical protein WCT06_06935 [Armatimonadota bacterium]|jgi:hypothetical protein